MRLNRRMPVMLFLFQRKSHLATRNFLVCLSRCSEKLHIALHAEFAKQIAGMGALSLQTGNSALRIACTAINVTKLIAGACYSTRYDIRKEEEKV